MKHDLTLIKGDNRVNEILQLILLFSKAMELCKSYFGQLHLKLFLFLFLRSIDSLVCLLQKQISIYDLGSLLVSYGCVPLPP